MFYPTPRSIRHALDVLGRLPTEALAHVAERIIERLDAAEPDSDREEETDACPAGEDGGYVASVNHGVGDATDGEDGGSDEPDGDDEPDFDGEFDDDPAVEKAWLLAAAERAVVRPEPCRQIGAVQGRGHGVDGAWVAMQ